MKGLLLKDIYMAVKYCRVYFLIAVVFAVALFGATISFWRCIRCFWSARCL